MESQDDARENGDGGRGKSYDEKGVQEGAAKHYAGWHTMGMLGERNREEGRKRERKRERRQPRHVG